MKKKKGKEEVRKQRDQDQKGRKEECFITKKEIRKKGDGEKQTRKHEVEKEKRKRNTEMEK